MNTNGRLAVGAYAALAAIPATGHAGGTGLARSARRVMGGNVAGEVP